MYPLVYHASARSRSPNHEKNKQESDQKETNVNDAVLSVILNWFSSCEIHMYHAVGSCGNFVLWQLCAIGYCGLAKSNMTVKTVKPGFLSLSLFHLTVVLPSLTL
ncbi:hypothetical protein Droror1_Dr00027684 [Drosera rotundifolia]